MSDGFGSYESQGSVHKQLTFSEFLGQSYDTEVSEKFVDYLKHCFRMSPPSCTHHGPLIPVFPKQKKNVSFTLSNHP